MTESRLWEYPEDNPYGECTYDGKVEVYYNICNILTDKYKYKLKGVGELQVHLGCDFFRDQDNILCIWPKRYIK